MLEAAVAVVGMIAPGVASAAGLLLGGVLGVVLFTRTRRSAADVDGEQPPVPRTTRQTRASQILEDLAKSRASHGPTPSGSGAVAGRSPSAADGAPPPRKDDEWETDESAGSGGNDDDAEEEEEESIPDSEWSEYERMEGMKLKMVFVVRQFAPKLPAHAVAELTAGAGVGLIEWINALSTRRSAGVAEASPPLSPNPNAAGEWHRHGCLAEPRGGEVDTWLMWYAWWNRIGCAKITLRCSDADVMEAVVAAAVLNRLPVYVMRMSDDVSIASPRESGGGGRQGRGAKQPPAVSEVAQQSPPLAAPDTENDVVIVALGPAPAESLDPITGKLKLFS